MFRIRSNGTLNSANTENGVKRLRNCVDTSIDSLTTLVHNVFGRNFLNGFRHSLPRRHRFLLHSRRDARRKRNILCFNIVRALSPACFHVENIETEALLLDSIVCIYGHGIVIIVSDAVLQRRRLNMKLLCIVIDDTRVIVQVCVAATGADRWRCDCDSRRSVPTYIH